MCLFEIMGRAIAARVGYEYAGWYRVPIHFAGRFVLVLKSPGGHCVTEFVRFNDDPNPAPRD